MKHLLNDLTEQEKNSIREQHKGGMNVVTENFSKLINTNSGDVKPLVNESVMNEETAKECNDNDLGKIPKIITNNGDLNIIFNQLSSGVITVISNDAKINCWCRKDKLMQFLK
jgi:hypothetical protein